MALNADDRFRVLKMIGKGSFGEVFQAVDLQTKDQIAVKIEKLDTEKPMLVHEFEVMQVLQGTKGVPRVHYTGKDSFGTFMVTDLLGPSLEDLLNLSNRKFSLKTVLMLTGQLVRLLESIHNKRFVHRDIKPQNFLMGLDLNSKTVFAIDFGLSKQYMCGSEHIGFRQGKNMTGTVKFVSMFTHMGFEQSRRDDLESLSYMLIYMQTGKLPWQEVDAENKQDRYQKIFEKKSSTSLETLCFCVPEEFKHLVSYARSLKFEEKPDYALILRSFENLFIKSHFVNDSIYDWTRLGCRKDSLTLDEYSMSLTVDSDQFS